MLTEVIGIVCACLTCLVESKMMNAVQFGSDGAASSMRIGKVPIPELRDHEVLIRVYATAINRADILQRKGRYAPPPGESEILGLEAVGTVETIGPNCVSRWSVGDRVMTLLAGGGNAEYVSGHEDLLMPIPAGLTFTKAAAIPEVWLTAFQLLHTVGKIQAEESVLIHAGGSGVGTAAVQLASLVGATPIVTAGSETKISKAKELGAAEGFNYKEGDFGPSVLQATKGKGVDLILDCVGESFYDQNMQSIKTDGRWVLYGLLGGGNVNGDMLAKMLRKRISITGTTLRARSIQYKGDLVRNFTDAALHHFDSGKLKPIVDKVFPLENISDAHKYMESNANTGKIVIEVRPEDVKDEL
ncbi:quinone oxidoreductase PIG3-like isoform X2 [Mizuhopecten yessoensis]|uniref:quinone oxidoreductase PIG3-like isoform X2 n=1 Tax=Mizuhopecten yessoensis TaxID=6573 RepID=UPI000B45DCAC|nr:quinone oxidoreductase PIG3-like isoform X2 [Mizuhopecten yessoensis]